MSTPEFIATEEPTFADLQQELVSDEQVISDLQNENEDLRYQLTLAQSNLKRITEYANYVADVANTQAMQLSVVQTYCTDLLWHESPTGSRARTRQLVAEDVLFLIEAAEVELPSVD